MASPNEISISQLSRLVGLPSAPALIDVRTDEEFAAEPLLIPGSVQRAASSPSEWAGFYTGQPSIVICRKGARISQGVAAWLRHEDIPSETLEGGFEAYKATGHPLLRTEKLPQRDAEGRTVWVTRVRPKIDRIACPWLIRRFVDPQAVFLFVAPAEVTGVAERFGGAPFDIEGVFWSHRGEKCTFDTMLDEFGLELPALRQLATIVRGADTARPNLAPEAPGLLAVSLGLSRMYRNDLEQLDAGMTIYDGLYRWARDAADETHNWPTNKPGAPS